MWPSDQSEFNTPGLIECNCLDHEIQVLFQILKKFTLKKSFSYFFAVEDLNVLYAKTRRKTAQKIDLRLYACMQGT